MARQWVGVAIGAVVGATIAGIGLAAIANRQAESPKAKAKATSKPPKKVTLAAGSSIEFLLLRPLHSGDVDEGETAQMVVTKDVNAGGLIVVPAGTVGELEVVRSREASVMSQMINQPARLEVVFRPINVDGAEIALLAVQDEPDEPLELTRRTSSRDEASAALKALWEHPETQDFLTRLSERMNGEGSSEDFDDPDSRRILTDVADQLGLTATSKAIKRDGRSVGAMLLATEKAGRGQFSSMNSAEALLAFQAVTELAHVANGVDRGIRGKIKGRNIKIPIGTRLTAYTAESVTIER